MRILLIIKNFDLGGAENHLCDLANYLDSTGNQVYVIGRQGRQQFKLNKAITFIHLPLNSFISAINLIKIVYYVRHYKIELIHAHQRHSIFLSALTAAITKIPLVATVHGRSQYDLRSWISRKYANRIIFVSQFVMKASIRFPEIQNKVIYIPNGVPVVQKSILSNTNRISYISRIDEKHYEVLRLMIHQILPLLIKDYPEISFNIVGEGNYLQKVINEVAQLNKKFNKEICVVSGYQTEVMELIQNSALIMGVGRVALEALACGTPVLSINRNRMGTMVSNENYGFYKANNFVAVGHNPPDSESLNIQLKDFFYKQSFWQKETQFISTIINKEFNREKIAAQIESLYKELVKF